MARLNVNATTKTAEILIGGETAYMVLRIPTIEEMQDFNGSQVVVTGKKAHDRSLVARRDFFDMLLVEIRDLEDEDGQEISADRKDVIPPELKARVILQLFETPDFTVMEKN